MAAVAGGIAVWVTHDSRTPLQKDCAEVSDLGRQAHDLGTWMNDGLDNHTIDNLDEIVDRESTLSDRLRAAAGSVTTSEMKQPLATWADAMALSAQLQRESNAAAGADPSPEWMGNAYRYNAMVSEALDALDRRCPGLKQLVRVS
ncbi:hypothetical protein [[Mycobacterium] crassicus]|uniref:Uncharacterized protein n=1 Tax=[Mycobacterium] crassicus TaxID=2872309 RepID=A0ABU5XEB5_9MYCO|nr:hypothetical protein [Mycolicibacter sp. MYC098]MEB3020640.1 hypothetical protein [Mycolicibacter sp. MYC098]